MNCEGFDRWLDGGRPAAAAREALDHARACARCTRALEAERAVAALLSAPPAPAPPALVARVMEDVAGIEAARLRAATAAPLPWWVMVAADPAAAAALALAALLAWQGRALVAAVAAWLGGMGPRVSEWSAALVGRIGDALHPAAADALALALLPPLAWLAWWLGRQCERVTVAATAPRV